MYDHILTDIKKPQDIEAAVAELVQATHNEIQTHLHNPAALQEFASWLQAHQTEIALGIATEAGEPMPNAVAGEQTQTAAPPPERKKRSHRPAAH